LEEKIKKYNVLLGATDATGQGVTITIADANITNTMSSLLDPHNLIVHDKDILEIVNELKNAGAEAIEVNGQRIVENTAISCDGNVIVINGEKVSSPFTINAIGFPSRLATLNRPGGYLKYELEETSFIKTSFKEVDKITIPKYIAGTSFKFAKTINEDLIKIKNFGNITLRNIGTEIKGIEADRSEYINQIEQSFEQNNIIMLTGTEGTGKSALLKNIVNKYINNKNCIIFSDKSLSFFNDGGWQGFSNYLKLENSIEDILFSLISNNQDIYLKLIKNKIINNANIEELKTGNDLTFINQEVIYTISTTSNQKKKFIKK
jgi:hypothetical protein